MVETGETLNTKERAYQLAAEARAAQISFEKGQDSETHYTQAVEVLDQMWKKALQEVDAPEGALKEFEVLQIGAFGPLKYWRERSILAACYLDRSQVVRDKLARAWNITTARVRQLERNGRLVARYRLSRRT